MDKLIKRFHAVPDDDLMLCDARGVAYQRDMTKNRKVYDDTYMAKVDAYKGNDIEQKCIAGRIGMLDRNLPPKTAVLDWGSGSGSFVSELHKSGYGAFGYDPMPESVRRLKSCDAFSADVFRFDAVTCWDTLEHMESPCGFLSSIKRDALLFMSTPIFDSLQDIRNSKHYRPGEHLYYFTRQGLIDWMAMHEFRVLEELNYENEAGREGIGSFVFSKTLKSYRDFIGQYHDMHDARYYGSSAVELHLKIIADVVRKTNPQSILDFGCGRSDLVAHFWLDGKRKIVRYDPAIRKFNHLPREKFALVLCCDVMEHIPILYVDKVLQQIQRLSTRCVFTISTKLARAKLPDGSNAHCTLLTTWEWIKWIRSYFPFVHTLPSEWEHELILMATGDKTL